MKTDRVLCPSDFSESSRRALAHAVELAREWGGTVDVLHVHTPAAPLVPAPPMTPVPGPAPTVEATPPPGPPPSEALRTAGRDLRRFVAPLEKAGAPVVTTLREEGDPVATILEHAERTEVDTIVMGTRGRSGLERLVLGSTAEKVLGRATCPVLTLREESPGPAVPRRLLCPVDFSESSREALRQAIALAVRARASVQVINVVRPEPVPPAPAVVGGGAEEVDRARNGLQELLDEVLNGKNSEGTRPVLETSIVQGTPSEAIVAAAEKGSTDLIVMGLQGHGTIDRMLFGPTTHHVVREAPCPVLSVRQRPN